MSEMVQVLVVQVREVGEGHEETNYAWGGEVMF